MPTYVTTGFVLGMRPWREGDRLYTLFTERQGKLEVIAAGTRKPNSKLSPHLVPFGEVEVMVARGKQLDRLASATLKEVYLKPPYDLPTAVLGSALLEVADVLTSPGQPEPRLHELMRAYLNELKQLSQVGTAWRPAARRLLVEYLLGALKLLGLAVPLTQCERCHKELVDPTEFSWQSHGFYHRTCFPPEQTRVALPSAALNWLKRALGEGGAGQHEMPPSALTFVTDYVTGHVGRRLYTLKVLRSIL